LGAFWLADRVILVMQPLGGDEIQFLEAGIVEVPRTFVMKQVRRAERPGALNQNEVCRRRLHADVA
jgi:putative protein kinase ArgK-like GTPase of G3E family